MDYFAARLRNLRLAVPGDLPTCGRVDVESLEPDIDAPPGIKSRADQAQLRAGGFGVGALRNAARFAGG